MLPATSIVMVLFNVITGHCSHPLYFGLKQNYWFQFVSFHIHDLGVETEVAISELHEVSLFFNSLILILTFEN